VEKLAGTVGVQVPGDDEERRNRLAGLGPLNGIATGIAVGIGGAAMRTVGVRPAVVPGLVFVGAVAMAASNLPMAMLGVTNPRAWSAADWLSDAIPHLAYGAAVHGALRALDR
jgi:hypothetical protein